jgi:glycosyltransferase involved in cell wall biosynthesis
MLTTRARESWIGQSVRYFLRQDYPNRELIVASAGLPPGLVREDPSIRHIYVPDNVPLGEKRNIATAEAHGHFVAHWDDDDWYAPWRISEQVRVLGKTGLRVSGCRTLLFIDIETGVLWEYRYAHEKPYGCGPTLFYERSAWEETPFRAVPQGHDTFWCEDCDLDIAQPPRRVCIMTAHAYNTCPRPLHSSSTYRVVGRMEDALPTEDLVFYQQLVP